jgi:magnesium-transporting ATPase (P-type)
MDHQHQPLETLQDIKRIMERSSRFISLSGWSGISAGICALIGAWAAHTRLGSFVVRDTGGLGEYERGGSTGSNTGDLFFDLLLIAIVTFVAAFISAFFFTYIRSRRNGVPLWDRTVQRLAWNTIMPMVVGGIVILRALQFGYYELVAPGCLIFYGLALVNASKYTLGEVRYLGYGQIILGILNLWIINEGLYFWAAGFGVLHIIYGAMMWWKYER